MRLVLAALVFAAGAGLVVQAPLNARLRTEVASPLASIAITVTASLVLLIILSVLGVGGKPRMAGLAQAPWWAYCGGLLGTAYLVISMIALPRLGAAFVVVSAVCGQMLASLALDTAGWLGVPRVPLTSTRVAGAALLLAAVFLLQRPAAAGQLAGAG